VFFSVTMSMDGFIAPEERMDDPDVQCWMAQWMELQQWIFPHRFFRENLKLAGGGEEGRDNDVVRETFERTGASVMGKRMFDLGEQAWPEEAPFHSPVFVVTQDDAAHEGTGGSCAVDRPGADRRRLPGIHPDIASHLPGDEGEPLLGIAARPDVVFGDGRWARPAGLFERLWGPVSDELRAARSSFRCDGLVCANPPAPTFGWHPPRRRPHV
jgi:dihydrofolate reductase